MSDSRPVCLAVDLGATKILTGVVDDTGRVLARVYCETEAPQGPASVVERMVAGARTVMDHVGRPIAWVGLGSPGPISTRRRLILSPPNLPGWDAVPLADMLSERLGLPVAFDNDANLGALGEYRWGAGRGATGLVYVTISTGVGGGVVLDGRIWQGHSDVGGEIGHVVVRPDGPPCGCGKAGCLEMFMSGPALARMTGLPSGKAVVDGAHQGNQRALAAIRQAGEELGRALAMVVGVLNPDRIVIGGSVAVGAGDLLLKPAIDTMRASVFSRALDGLEVVLTALGSDSGLLGAAALAFAAAGESAVFGVGQSS